MSGQDNKENINTADLSNDRPATGISNVIGLPLSRQFEDVLSDIENILLSDQTPFCKTFAIADLVRPEIIYNIDVPEVEMSDWSKNQLQTM